MYQLFLSPEIIAWDLRMTRRLQTLKSKPIIAILDITSWIGYYPQVLLFITLPVIALYFWGTKHEMILGAASFTLIFIIVSLLQVLFKRPRPTTIQLITVRHLFKTKSFPSSHVTMYVVIFGYLAFLVSLSSLSCIPKSLLLLLLFTPIVLVGPSRVYRGEHWASDTIGGYVLGLVWLYLTISLLS